MATQKVDQRSSARRVLDDQIALEAHLAPLELPADAVAAPMETHLDSLRKPLAVAGVVENGLVRPLDPSVKLLENSRVIIVASENV